MFVAIAFAARIGRFVVVRFASALGGRPQVLLTHHRGCCLSMGERSRVRPIPAFYERVQQLGGFGGFIAIVKNGRSFGKTLDSEQQRVYDSYGVRNDTSMKPKGSPACSRPFFDLRPALFIHPPSEPNATPPPQKSRLRIEQLEDRTCPSAGTLSLNPPLVLPNHQVQISGYVTDGDPQGFEISVSGAATGTATSDSAGYFSITDSNASLGEVDVVATRDLETDTASATIAVDAPVLTMSIVSMTSSTVDVTGSVSGIDVSGLTVWFGANAEGTAITDENGNFSGEIFAALPGPVCAYTYDLWGQVSNTVNASYLSMDVPTERTDWLGDTIDWTINTMDSANNPLSFSATNLPPGLSMDGATGFVSGTVPTNADTTQPYDVTISVTDAQTNTTASQEIEWNFNTPSVVLQSPGDQLTVGGATVNLPIWAWSAPGHSIDFTADGLPPGLSMGSDGTISGTLSSSGGTVSSYLVNVTATDTAANVSDTVPFAWNVMPVLLSNPGYQRSLIGDTVDVTFSTLRESQSAWAFSATNLPDGLGIDSATGEITGTIASDAVAVTPYSVNVTASDGACSVTQTFKWRVSQIYLQNPGSQSNVDGETVNVAVTAAAAFGNAVTFTAAGLPGGLTIDSATGAITGTIANDADANGPYDASVTATDTNGNSVTKSFSWVVQQQQDDGPLSNAELRRLNTLVGLRQPVPVPIIAPWGGGTVVWVPGAITPTQRTEMFGLLSRLSRRGIRFDGRDDLELLSSMVRVEGLIAIAASIPANGPAMAGTRLNLAYLQQGIQRAINGLQGIDSQRYAQYLSGRLNGQTHDNAWTFSSGGDEVRRRFELERMLYKLGTDVPGWQGRPRPFR
jgi:hypothetical protein